MTEYSYSPLDLVSNINYNEGKEATFSYFEVNTKVNVYADLGPECAVNINGSNYMSIAYFQQLMCQLGYGIDYSQLTPEEQYIQNLKKNFTTTKMDSMVVMARRLFNDGYKVAFVAGVLANIYYEAELGKFESSKLYMQEAGKSDTINKEQAIRAETKMISQELAGDYNYVYKDWLAANPDFDSGNAAEDAARRVCYYYERPRNRTSVAEERAPMGRTIYNAMINK